MSVEAGFRHAAHRPQRHRGGPIRPVARTRRRQLVVPAGLSRHVPEIAGGGLQRQNDPPGRECPDRTARCGESNDVTKPMSKCRGLSVWLGSAISAQPVAPTRMPLLIEQPSTSGARSARARPGAVPWFRRRSDAPAGSGTRYASRSRQHHSRLVLRRSERPVCPVRAVEHRRSARTYSPRQMGMVCVDTR